MKPGQSVKSSPVCFPPDPNPKTPRLKLPAGSWDSHFHVLGPPHLFPYVEGRWQTVPAAPIEHYFSVARILGFERGVVVLPSGHGLDCAVVLDAIKKSDGRLRGVIRADSHLDEGDLKKLHAAGVRGIRVELRREATTAGVYGMQFDPRELDGVFEGARFEELTRLAAKLNWSVALHIDPDTLIRLADVIRRIPGPAIIENYAGMDARLGVDQPAMKMLRDLSAEPHVWIKAASAYRMLLNGTSYDQLLPMARAVHALCPDRTIWGTDWPHTGIFAPGQIPNDGELVDTLLDFVPNEANRRKLLVNNPKRLFDFD